MAARSLEADVCISLAGPWGAAGSANEAVAELVAHWTPNERVACVISMVGPCRMMACPLLVPSSWR